MNVQETALAGTLAARGPVPGAPSAGRSRPSGAHHVVCRSRARVLLEAIRIRFEEVCAMRRYLLLFVGFVLAAALLAPAAQAKTTRPAATTVTLSGWSAGADEDAL